MRAVLVQARVKHQLRNLKRDPAEADHIALFHLNLALIQLLHKKKLKYLGHETGSQPEVVVNDVVLIHLYVFRLIQEILAVVVYHIDELVISFALLSFISFFPRTLLGDRCVVRCLLNFYLSIGQLNDDVYKYKPRIFTRTDGLMLLRVNAVTFMKIE